mmetsp:Transcript_10267/g.30348  ORF Transcript_10267/g.30348 Transcript_10267/m.30348 type:complete len:223 (+) Transcript_10267:1190-1858(+)
MRALAVRVARRDLVGGCSAAGRVGIVAPLLVAALCSGLRGARNGQLLLVLTRGHRLVLLVLVALRLLRRLHLLRRRRGGLGLRLVGLLVGLLVRVLRLLVGPGGGRLVELGRGRQSLRRGHGLGAEGVAVAGSAGPRPRVLGLLGRRPHELVDAPVDDPEEAREGDGRARALRLLVQVNRGAAVELLQLLDEERVEGLPAHGLEVAEDLLHVLEGLGGVPHL